YIITDADLIERVGIDAQRDVVVEPVWHELINQQNGVGSGRDEAEERAAIVVGGGVACIIGGDDMEKISPARHQARERHRMLRSKGGIGYRAAEGRVGIESNQRVGWFARLPGYQSLAELVGCADAG